MIEYTLFFQRLTRTKALSIKLKDALTEVIRINKFEAQESFLSPGNYANSLYYIQSGMLRGSIEGENEKITTWFKQEDEIVLPQGIISGQPGEEYVSAVIKTTLLSISVNHLRRIMHTFPEMNELFILLMEEKHNQDQYRERMLRIPAAKERYNYLLKHEGFILKRVPHYLIASYLNVTKETFSRLHKGLSY